MIIILFPDLFNNLKNPVNSSLSRIEKTLSDDLKKMDATTNLVEFCLKNSLPEPIFQTNDSGCVLAKVGKFEFLAKKSKHGRSMVSWNTRNIIIGNFFNTK